ncbi:hypothetical protein M427DRAFT_326898 [Gonapodya prolifera JEL478]|uniref:Uncharacterized protein n=1 Tax=Gonapodya prolifera (strain JEL478) TaxID=1344416 RepID=A0A139AFC8_GONPJ|nr:hypothetical protein M427DRAFT_326898 [Gonapodya prolifera JEL478]|eukprot:KXS15274.1 hypothetical protein M427DRAFT_326898 [Gonapodya prolifera JEL478]
MVVWTTDSSLPPPRVLEPIVTARDSLGPRRPEAAKQKVLTELRNQYEAFMNGGSDYSSEESLGSTTTYFVGSWRNLSRFPTSANEFWAVFMILFQIGVTEMISNHQYYVTAWDDGNCFGVAHHVIKTVFGDVWEGDLLQRSLYDDNGTIYSQAIFVERMADFDTIFGKLLDMAEVQKALDMCGIKLRTSGEQTDTQTLPESQYSTNPAKVFDILQENGFRVFK